MDGTGSVSVAGQVISTLAGLQRWPMESLKSSSLQTSMRGVAVPIVPSSTQPLSPRYHKGHLSSVGESTFVDGSRGYCEEQPLRHESPDRAQRADPYRARS